MGPVVLEELTAENIRCLERVHLHLHPGLNLIWGPNGSGKTSLLEAIFLLGRGRSFRTRTSERLIRHGQERLVALGRLQAQIPHTIGVQVAKAGGTEARIDGRPATSFAELAQTFPVQAIEPGVHKLVEEGGYRRRRWLDWAVFHVEPSHAETWARYARGLRQRNVALRQSPSESGAWDPELVRAGDALDASRCRLFEALEPYWRRVTGELTGLDIELAYFRGWPADRPLADALAGSAERDRSHGLTHVGPHRADVRIRLHGRAAREVLSRGQQKLVAVAMILAQLEFLRERLGITPTLLLDDPAAELDDDRIERFIAAVQRIAGQLITTALQPDRRLFGPPDQVFHVEQGRAQTL